MSINVQRNGMMFALTFVDGQKEEYRGLFTFPSEETGKTYLAFTEDTDDDVDEIHVYALILASEGSIAKGEEPRLLPIETDEEWAIVESLLSDVDEQYFDVNEEGGFNEYAWRIRRRALLDRNSCCDAPHDDDD